MSDIAILGSGRVAGALATALVRGGHRVTIGSRDLAATKARWQGPAVTLADTAQAIAAANMIFNATPGDSSVERLAALAGPLSGKILIDVANATSRDANGRPAGLLYPSDSLAERLQAALPATRVVKTLNTMLFSVMADPAVVKGGTAFISGEDDDSRKLVATLLLDMGWSPKSIVDLGSIASARGPEAMMLIVGDIVRARGFAPFAISIAT
ncbi:NAD(P)-binding domain-containing protein [Gluconobacter wancherniae]|uniref:NADPH-dependent F420 reductase n=1 Tax=Gluconobacter TaxID=441 RepID=UPI001B8AE4A0|nr:MULTISPECIES: NAD(P)-binding domain-containing protein [Gluconobacter]MBS1039098.1 NAD(P)-binding domain-containing protein [Gluconobacter cerinus]MBS1063956.1 NAD(P)-binding domain-containing protein [Gluconobacter wancherniae]MBS1072732.1 NAD(P)-binding domain-containing protein [Gluconobacter cerinus]MBS1089948.1 NAD(P)-binding domain-containing protein [Gluconobacter wancherniae]MCW2267187.1 putative dinucleotide-binding enzyme [Gluconobacter cerinus]